MYDGRLCFHRCVSVRGGGGVPGLSKGKIFWHQIWLDTRSGWEKNFCRGDPPPPGKGKNSWHQIWLDTCSDQEKNFVEGCPAPPPVKGKFFDTRFGLIHVQTGKNFLSRAAPPRPTPPPSKGKNFWHQIWLDTCSDQKKIFWQGPSRPPPPSKGKNFWHQIWLDTCSDWKKNFCQGPPGPPPQ